MPGQDFLQSAFRHAKDAKILYNNQRYDNAIYHYGFAAECAIKEIANRFGIGDLKKYFHGMDTLLEDEHFFDLIRTSASFWSPALLLGTDALRIPEVLVQHHPDRRYFSDDTYSQTDCDLVRPCIQNLEDLLVKDILDTQAWEGIF